MSQIFKRQTIKFSLPVDYASVYDNTFLGREIIPMYINPDQIQFSDTKLINETNTLGGYIVQYWGEKITEISINGNTGSGGIEAINILRSVYRNEQISFQRILLNRQANLAKDSQSALEDLAATADAKGGLVALADVFFDGVVSDTIDSVKETIEYIKNPTGQIFSEGNPIQVLYPTLASFAVSVGMHIQGETYQGFFRDFSVTESISNYGTFNYSMKFAALSKTGERKNFMPWHKNPRSILTNQPIQEYSLYSENTYGLSFPSDQDRFVNSASSTVRDGQEGRRDATERSRNRYSDINSKK
jgi:hypothetical protein